MATKKNEQVVAKELRGRADGELRSLLASKADELHKLKFKLSLGQLRTTHEIKELKRDVARLYTVLNEKKNKAGSAA
jgi:large subunit ribosomal protein L29